LPPPLIQLPLLTQPLESKLLAMRNHLDSTRPEKKLLVLPLIALVIFASSCSLKTVGDDVAASVDGQKIYRADVDKYFQSQTAGSSQPLSDEQATSLRLSILNTLIENEILMHRAAKLGLLATDEEVDRRLNEVKSPYSASEFAQRLSERKMSLDDFRHDVRRTLTAEKVLNKEVTSKINITQQDITDYYNGHRAEFNLIEPRYHLAHILVTTSSGAPAQDNGNKAHNAAEARQKIEAVLGRLQAGDDFSRLAMTYSEDSSTAPNGGDVGIAPESALKQTDAATREAVVKLKPGQFTPIIALSNPQSRQVAGFQIVKLIAVEPAGQRELSDPRVEQQIRSQLQDRREQLMKAAYYEVMHDQAKIENYFAQRLLEK